MKTPLMLCLLAAASLAWANDGPKTAGPVHGVSGHHAKPADAADMMELKVPKAAGPNARTVEEIVTHAAELKGKPVEVRGRIVKYNAGIMGKNWVHIRDGSGSAKDNSNDLLVTTTNAAKLGEVVTASGIVRTDKDFGAGYAYKVLVEEATLK